MNTYNTLILIKLHMCVFVKSELRAYPCSVVCLIFIYFVIESPRFSLKLSIFCN